MRKLTNLVLAVALVAGVVGATTGTANADNKKKPNYQEFAGAWYYPWVGPGWGQGGYQEAGSPFKGTHWTKDYSGEVVYLDSQRMQVKADGSGDVMNFYLYEGQTVFTPSFEGLRQGSKVKVRTDDRRRVRDVTVVPFYQWLKGRTK